MSELQNKESTPTGSYYLKMLGMGELVLHISINYLTTYTNGMSLYSGEWDIGLCIIYDMYTIVLGETLQKKSVSCAQIYMYYHPLWSHKFRTPD
jgi:hypothetical protein